MKRNMLMLMLLLISFFSLTGQEENFVKANYDKSEFQVEMRDGVRLYTIVYTPKDRSESYPILMQRTPYSIGPYGEGFRRSLSPNGKLEKDKYIFVFQDVRGKFMSEGEFADMRPVLYPILVFIRLWDPSMPIRPWSAPVPRLLSPIGFYGMICIITGPSHCLCVLISSWISDQ